MKITDIKAFTMDAFRTNWTFIKVETDEGLYGWGEASLGTREHALEGCVEDMKRMVVGRNPIDKEKMWFEVYRDSYWKGGPVMMSALSGIEIACWDIAGKFYNAPVCNLIGGRLRDKVPMYANAWFTGARTPEEFAEKAKYTVSKGVKALKWDPFGKAHMTLSRREMDAAVACVGAVREAVGPEVELLIECHGRFNHFTAVSMSRELAPFKPMFIEEPTVPDCIDSLKWVRDHSMVPVAAGERFYGKYAFWDVLHKEAIDIAQPDIFHNGGILAAGGLHPQLPDSRDHDHRRHLPPERDQRESVLSGWLYSGARQARPWHPGQRGIPQDTPLRAPQPAPLHRHPDRYPPQG